MLTTNEGTWNQQKLFLSSNFLLTSLVYFLPQGVPLKILKYSVMYLSTVTIEQLFGTLQR